MNERIKLREIFYVISTITVATSVAIMAGCGGSSSNNNSSSDTANEATCISNVKQVGLAFEQYIQDYDEDLPPPVHGAPETWAGRLSPYIKGNTPYYTCPDDHTGSGLTGTGSSVVPPPVTVSYALNSNCQSSGSPISIAAFNATTLTVMLFEVSGDSSQVTLYDEGTSNYTGVPSTKLVSASGDGLTTAPEWGYLGTGASPLHYATGPMGGRTQITGAARHSGGSNYSAVDGHVVFLVPNKVSSGTTNPSTTGVQDTPSGAAAGTGTYTPASGFSLTFSVN